MSVDVENIIECKVCGLFVDSTQASHTHFLKCPRCETKLNVHTDHGFDALFYALSALMLFVLINVFPLIDLSFVGMHLQTNLSDTIFTLFGGDMFLVGMIVFFTIVLMPLLNSIIIIISFIQNHSKFKIFTETLLHDSLHFTQNWTFMEVFILSIIVTYIKLVGMVSSTKFDVGFYIFIPYLVCFYLSNRKFEGRSVFGE